MENKNVFIENSNYFLKNIENFVYEFTGRLRQKIPENLSMSDSSGGGGGAGEFDSQNGCSDVDDIIHVKISIFIKRTTRGGNNRIGSSANTVSNRRGK